MGKKRTNEGVVCDLEASALAQEAKRMTTLSRDHVACLSSQVAVVSPFSSFIDSENESVESVSSVEAIPMVDFDDLFAPHDPDTHASSDTTAQRLIAEAMKASPQEKQHYIDNLGCITTTPMFFHYSREVSLARDNLQAVGELSSNDVMSYLLSQK